MTDDSWPSKRQFFIKKDQEYEKNTKFLIFLFITLFLASFLLSRFFVYHRLQFKSFDVLLDDVPSLLTVLFITSLLLERSLEVFLNTFRDAGREIRDNNIRAIRRKIKLLERENQNQSTRKVTTTQAQITDYSAQVEQLVTEGPEEIIQDGFLFDKRIERLFQQLKEANDLREQYRSRTRRIALFSASSLGVLISSVGVRSLETFIDPAANFTQMPQPQSIIFQLLDIFLTAGVIAGGSEVIHKILSVFTTFIEAASKIDKDPGHSGPSF